MRFADRADAGRRLAEALAEYRGRRPAVLAVPRGGLIVGREVARALGGELAALAVKKVALPSNPERALGAVAADGTRVVGTEVARLLGVSDDELALAIDQALTEARRRESLYPCIPPPLAGRPALVVDDGLATGYTCLVAARYVRRFSPSELLVAVPVAARASAALLRRECDRLVALLLPDDMEAVGQYYDDFAPTTDEEVVAILREFGVGPPSNPPGGPDQFFPGSAGPLGAADPGE